MASLGFIIRTCVCTSLPCAGCNPVNVVPVFKRKRQRNAERNTNHGAVHRHTSKYIPVGTFSVHYYCVTCHGPNILSAVFMTRFSPVRAGVQQSLQHHAVCPLLASEWPQASAREGTTSIMFNPSLVTHWYTTTAVPPS